MDTRQSFYLAPGRDDFDELPPDASRLVSDIPYVAAANDNFQAKDRLAARCATFLRRLIGLHKHIGARQRLPRQAPRSVLQRMVERVLS